MLLEVENPREIIRLHPVRLLISDLFWPARGQFHMVWPLLYFLFLTDFWPLLTCKRAISYGLTPNIFPIPYDLLFCLFISIPSCYNPSQFLFFWSIVDLQCCVNFCYTAKWFNYTYIYILFSKYAFPLWFIIGSLI